VAHRSFHDQCEFLYTRYFPRIAWSKLTIRPKKSKFFLDGINPLGFVLKGKGLRRSEDKVQAIRDYPRPTSLDDVIRFLCMMTYLRHFIPGRADYAMMLKNVATLESKKDWHKRDSGRRDKTGRIMREPGQVEIWEWGEAQE
jgi:hypothetical protein